MVWMGWSLLLAGPLAAEPLVLEDAVAVENQAVPPNSAVEVVLPPLPAKPGKTVVLRFRMVLKARTEAGCNLNGAVRLNGTPLGRFTAAGRERLLGREPQFQFTKGNDGRVFPVFSGPVLMIMFAPDADRGDAMTTDGLGASFVMDVGDAAQGVDNNVLWLRNTKDQGFDGGGELVVTDLAVGWVDRAKLPAPPSRVPQRGAMAAEVTAGGLRLRQGTAGGFGLAMPDGTELLVDTAISAKADGEAALRAEDGPTTGVEVATRPWGPAGFATQARWPELLLTSEIELRDGLVRWRERWSNTSSAIRGVPFSHRCYLRDRSARLRLSGSPDQPVLACAATNPTVFVEHDQLAGHGFGVTCESDWLRLLAGLRAQGGVGEVYGETLALPPGATIEFELSITPVTDEGGYWTFLNALRRRWGVNGLTMARPMFWGYRRIQGTTDVADIMRRSLAHLGPIALVHGPWARLEPDAKVVRAGKAPKLAAGAPPALGKSPEFDVETFLTQAHREAYWKQFDLDCRRLRENVPGIRVYAMTHPSMEAIYKPLLDRWPIAGEVIRTADGQPFEQYGYSKAWVGDMVAADWGVLYFVPRPGSAYLAQLLDAEERALAAGADGIYCDEFSWAGNRRDYSRYDYSRWDGFSADLDADGKVLRLKSDNAAVTESCQLQMTAATVSRGRFFLGNGGNALRSLNDTPLHRFIEGGNGYWAMANGHLSPVPLVLGNMGDETTAAGVFESVKQCLSLGCVYSPTAVNLLLDGPDNFVCKLYPITVRELGPGWVVGEERLCTTVSRSYAWPGAKGRLRWHRYDAEGKLQPVTESDADGTVSVEVPPKGLVIVERLPAGAEPRP